MTVHYEVRDIATYGIDFLLWGENNLEAAWNSFHAAIADGVPVELMRIENGKEERLLFYVGETEDSD